MSWKTKKELKKFKSCGENVFISKDAIIFGPENVSIGNNVRIDAGVKILAYRGYLLIGDYIHIAVNSTFVCTGGIVLNDFTQIAANCTILSASDDFSGKNLIGPTVPYGTSVYKKQIVLEQGAVIGANCVLLPGTVLKQGGALGLLSSTKKDQVIPFNEIWAGSPCKKIGDRELNHFESMKLLIHENMMPKFNYVINHW